MERKTVHFWVAMAGKKELWEVDYYNQETIHGFIKWFKLHASERRCGCPDREKRENAQNAKSSNQ